MQWNQKPWELRYDWTKNGGQVNLIDKVILPEDPVYGEKQKKTIHIPVKNEITSQPESLAGIRFYAKRAKLYSAFVLCEYQRNELEYALAGDLKEAESMLRHFVRLLQRLDLWTDTEMVGLIGWYWDQIEHMMSALNAAGGINLEIAADISRIWTGLVAMSHVFEELWREWFLPTNLAQYLSYPDYPKTKSQEE